MSTDTIACKPAQQVDLIVQTREMFQTIAAVELFQAQIEVGKYLELGYLAVADHPDMANEVRMTAHRARTQHMMSSGLLKSFKVTAAHIVGTLIPQILDGVDLGDPCIVKETLFQILKLAEDMKMEASATKQGYYEIQTMVQLNLAHVKVRNKDVVDKEAKLKQDMETEKKLADNANIEDEELQTEQAEMEEELNKLRDNRDVYMTKMKKADDGSTKEDEGANTFLDSILTPVAAVIGPIALVVPLVKAGLNFFSSLLGGHKRDKELQRLTEVLDATQKAVEHASGEKREILAKKRERRKDALVRVANIAKMTQERAGLGDVQSLMEAAAGLGKVDRQFTRIIRWWENIVVMLKYLKATTKAGDVYLKKIENPKYTERFKNSITRAEKSWQWFGKLCSDYVATCERHETASIQAIYKFLSDPIDNMAADKRATRMKQIAAEIMEAI